MTTSRRSSPRTTTSPSESYATPAVPFAPARADSRDGPIHFQTDHRVVPVVDRGGQIPNAVTDAASRPENLPNGRPRMFRSRSRNRVVLRRLPGRQRSGLTLRCATPARRSPVRFHLGEAHQSSGDHTLQVLLDPGSAFLADRYFQLDLLPLTPVRECQYRARGHRPGTKGAGLSDLNHRSLQGQMHCAKWCVGCLTDGLATAVPSLFAA